MTSGYYEAIGVMGMTGASPVTTIPCATTWLATFLV
jgi:hypothetical protein